MLSFFKTKGKAKAEQKDGISHESAQSNEGASRNNNVHDSSQASTDAASRQSFESTEGYDSSDSADQDKDNGAVNRTYSNSYFGGSVVNRIIANSFNTAKYIWHNSDGTAEGGATVSPQSAPHSTPSQSPSSALANVDTVQKFIGNLNFAQAVDNENVGSGPIQLFEGNITFHGPVTNRNISQPSNTYMYNNVAVASAEADAVHDAEIERLIMEIEDPALVEEIREQIRRR